MAHWYTNSGAERRPVYEKAIAESGLPIWIGEPHSPHLPGAIGIYTETRIDLSKFWRAVERLDADDSAA